MAFFVKKVNLVIICTNNLEFDNVDAGLNYKPSIKRVNVVLSYIVSKVVNQNNLRARGFGENMPIASNETPEGRAENRRVEIKIVE